MNWDATGSFCKHSQSVRPNKRRKSTSGKSWHGTKLRNLCDAGNSIPTQRQIILPETPTSICGISTTGDLLGVESLWKYSGVDWIGIMFSMLSTYYLGKKRKRGFLIGMLGNLAFVVFGFMAGSIANVVANGCYFVLNARGWWKWKEEPPLQEREASSPQDKSPRPLATQS